MTWLFLPGFCLVLLFLPGFAVGSYANNKLTTEVKEKEFSCLGRDQGFYNGISKSCGHFYGCFRNATHITKVTYMCRSGYKFNEDLQACEWSPNCNSVDTIIPEDASTKKNSRTRRQVYTNEDDDIVFPYSSSATARIPAYLLDYRSDSSPRRSAQVILMGRRSTGYSPQQVIVVSPQTSRSIPQYLYRETEPQQSYNGMLTFHRRPPSSPMRPFQESANFNGVPESRQPPVIFFPNQPVPPFRPLPPTINRPSSSLEAERGSSEEDIPRYPTPEAPANGFRPSDSSRFIAPQFHPPRSRIRQETQSSRNTLPQELPQYERYPARQNERFIQSHNPPRQELDYQNNYPNRQEHAQNRHPSSVRQGYSNIPREEDRRLQNPPRQEIGPQTTRYGPPPTRLTTPYRSTPTRTPMEHHEESSEEHPENDPDEEVRYLPGSAIEEDSREEHYKKESAEEHSSQQDGTPRPTYPPPYYYRVHMNPPLKPTFPFASSSTPPPADLGRFRQTNRLQEPIKTTSSQRLPARTQENSHELDRNQESAITQEQGGYGLARNQEQQGYTPARTQEQEGTGFARNQEQGRHGTARTQEQGFTPARTQEQEGTGFVRNQEQGRHGTTRTQEQGFTPARIQEQGYGSSRNQVQGAIGFTRNQEQGSYGSTRTQEQGFTPARTQERPYNHNRHYGNRNQGNSEVQTTPQPEEEIEEEEEEPTTILPTTLSLTTTLPTPTTEGRTTYTKQKPFPTRRRTTYSRSRLAEKSTTTEHPTIKADDIDETESTTEYITNQTTKLMPNLFGSRVRNARQRLGKPRQRSTDELTPRAEASSLDEERFSPTRQLSQRARSRLFLSNDSASQPTET